MCLVIGKILGKIEIYMVRVYPQTTIGKINFNCG